jgi:hypothetical protein
MPAASTVCLVELAELTRVLRAAGLTLTWRQELTASHQATATALLRRYQEHSRQIASQIGTQATADLITAHRLWATGSAAGGYASSRWWRASRAARRRTKMTSDYERYRAAKTIVDDRALNPNVLTELHMVVAVTPGRDPLAQRRAR